MGKSVIKQKKLKGIAVSPGIVIAKAYVIDDNVIKIDRRYLDKKDIAKEIKRFKSAVKKTQKQLTNLKNQINYNMDEKHAHIFQAHLLILEDPMLIEETIKKIKERKLNSEYILTIVLEKISTVFSKMDDGYLKERLSDIQDVGNRLLRNLLGEKHVTWETMGKESIVVARDLSPSETASLHKERVGGFITDIGGKTSHTAIMARSLEIPAVLGLEVITSKARTGDTIIIDGFEGIVILNPSETTIKHYKNLKKKQQVVERELAKLKDMPAKTVDGKRIHLHANIEFPDEVDSVLDHGAEGIGLYRTEFLYMNREELPTEEEQFQAFREVAAKMVPKSVTIRTLDIGGDKFISYLNMSTEMNPFMGLRAIRLCLQHIDIFKSQIRAILRASVLKNLRIMFPMISGIEELKKAKKILLEVKKELDHENIPYDKEIKVGAMIEIPSAAVIADKLAPEVDFFSIGTNDLIQYTLAVERANEKVAYLYEPLHPAVLRLIKMTIDAAKKYNIDISMCGEMAGDLTAILILIGMGFTELSMSSVIIPEIKKIIRTGNYQEAVKLTEKAFKMNSAYKIEKIFINAVKKLS